MSTFLEGVPCIAPDGAPGGVHVDTEKTEGIEEFYENYSADNFEAFAISRSVAPGFYRFLERIGEIKDEVRFIKGQLTGPFSMGLGLKDENGKSIIYNYAFFDIVKKAIRMKAKWLISMVRKVLPGKEIILFFDEPYMVSFGSAYVSISREEAIALFNEVLDGIDVKRGVHCCGNTDWSVLFNTVVDIVNYDAFSFMETIFYYPEDLAKFLDRGGWISPGIVPSSPEILSVTVEDIVSRMDRFAKGMAEIDAGRSRDWLITTSCGLGSLKTEEAHRAMDVLRSLEGYAKP